MNDSAADLSLVTQYRIGGGTVPDLAIFVGSDPVCIVEVKIDAPLGENQLEGYGQWLAARADNRYRPALVLLTHRTPAPPGFIDRNIGAFGVELRSVASWNRVAEWFGEFRLDRADVGEPLKSLAGEFTQFLREDAMATLDDAAIARQYLADSQRKLTQTVDNMQVGFDFPQHWRRGKGLGAGPVGIWKYHYPEADRETRYVSCGLCFKSADEHDDALHGYARYENRSLDVPQRVEIRDGFFAFVCIYAPPQDCKYIPGFTQNRWYQTNGERLFQSKPGLTVGSTGWWHFSLPASGWAGYARICPLQDLLDHDARLGNELTRWIHRALQDTVSLWNALFGQSG